MLSAHRHSEICKGAGLRHRQPERCESQVRHPGRDGSPSLASLASLASRRLCYPPESGPATPATPCPGGFEIPILCAAAEESDILLTPEGSPRGYAPDFDVVAVKAALVEITSQTREPGEGLALWCSIDLQST